jgi:hypothetical protein
LQYVFSGIRNSPAIIGSAGEFQKEEKKER